MSTDEVRQVEAAVAALLAQRALLGDAVVDLAVAPLRARLAALASHPSSDQSLRQVTILFLDVVGSTALGERLDPEEIHALMDGALTRFTAIVEAHGGKVLQYAGDSLLAVFGSERANEEDAEHAVQAGLALLGEGKLQREAVRRDYRHDGFDVRVGVHTGSVLLGGGVDADGSIRGSAVNIAARLEQTAPPGALRISRDTYRQVRGRFDVDEQPPLIVKGIAEPITSYLVQRASPRTFRPSGRGLDGLGVAVAMIGRDAEMTCLTDALDAAKRERSLRMITVTADAGIGKSRLLLETERALERRTDSVRALHGRAQRHGLNTPYGVVRDMLAWHCGILDSDAPEQAAAKLRRSFGAAFGERADEQAALVGQLIGLDFSDDPHVAGIRSDGRQIRARAFHAIAQYLRLQCTIDDLVVLLLDDLHWADDGSLDLIEHLALACHDLPLVIGCFARPALFERRAGWGEILAHSSRIELHPLADDRSEVLVDSLLARTTEPPPELRTLLLRNAAGNPFHMEELFGMLIDDRVIVPAPGGWQVDRARLTRTRIPPTLTAVLQARLDSLPPSEKLALQHDSVIGHVFWDEALRQIAPQAIAALESLTVRALIDRRDGSAFAGVAEYAFKHHLLHQVTYDTVLKGPKRELHRRIAEWIVAQTGERIGEHVGLVADHYERANDAVNAARYLRRAAEAAFGAAAFGAASDYIDRALALTPDTDLRARFDLRLQRLDVDNATGRRTAMPDDLALLERDAETLDDDRCRAKAFRWRSLLSVLTGDYPATLVAADRAGELAAIAGDTDTALGALLDKAQALIFTGQSPAAEACLRSVLSLARSSDRATLECLAANRLNAIAQDRGDYVAARAWLETSLAVARRSANRRFEGALVGNLGLLEIRLGNHDIARELLNAALRVSRAIGDRGSEPYALCGLADIQFQQEDPGAALATVVEARAIAIQVADRGCEADCTLLLGRCHAALGHVAEAIGCFDAYEAWAAHASSRDLVLPSMPARAELALAGGRIDEAVDIVDSFVDRLDADDRCIDRHDLLRYFVCHRVLAAANAPRAGEFLDRAHAALREQAGRLPDDERGAYLGNIPLHRRIVAAWAEAR